jgi:hypothetical protein
MFGLPCDSAPTPGSSYAACELLTARQAKRISSMDWHAIVLFIVSIAVALLFFICGSRKFGTTYRPWDWLPRADIVGHTCALPSSLLFAPVSDPVAFFTSM